MHWFQLSAIFLIFFIFFKYLLTPLYNYLRIIFYIQKISGPPFQNLIFGNAVTLINKAAFPDQSFKQVRYFSNKYYPIYKLGGFHKWSVNILTPEDFEIILSDSKHNSKSYLYNQLHPWLGDGLLTSNEIKWQQRRKLLTPTFHFQILQDFLQVFIEQTNKFIENLQLECIQTPIIEITTNVSDFTLKSITETAMGLKLDYNNKIQDNYRHNLESFNDIMSYRSLRPWLSSNLIFALTQLGCYERKLTGMLHKFTNGIIAEKRRNQSNNGITKKKRMAMLDLLLTSGLDNEGIREEVDTFTFEGHDTTAMALSFALMLIACNKNVQDKIVEEIDTIMGDRIEHNPTYKDLQKMRYLERCIKETLRLYPSVHFIGRNLGSDITTSTGYFLAKGTMINLHIYDLHRSPQIYPNPEVFDPDRFLDEECQKRHIFAYLPFSAGPRNCIGQKFAMLEMKTILSGILRNFILEPIDRPETIDLCLHLTLKPKNGLRVKFLPRNKIF